MSGSLDEYRRKRDFSATAEPAGGESGAGPQASQSPTFCIQKHAARHLHYDFRLELDGTLKSWAVPKGPSLDPKVRRLAVQVEDHPLEYADFEGRIPAGEYGAGEVIVWDHGTWSPQGDPVAGYQKGKLKFELRGEKLSGSWNLVRSSNTSGKKPQWFLIKSNDASARSEQELIITEACPNSVISNRTLGDEANRTAPPQSISKAGGKSKAGASRSSSGASKTLAGSREAPMPDHLSPQLATLVDAPPRGDWHYEIKFDGYRILARIAHGTVGLFTRKGLDWADKMPAQARALASLDLHSAWLDGEVVVADANGLPNFQALQNAINNHHSEQIVFYLFDLPYLNGHDLRQVPLEQRRTALAKLLDATGPDASDLLRFSRDFSEIADVSGRLSQGQTSAKSAQALLKTACELGLEGLIGKRAGSPYSENRSKDWIKIKCGNRQEFVVVGFTDPKGSRSHFGALLLGLHDAPGGPLRYAGKVGTGFSADTLARVYRTMAPLEVDAPMISNPPRGAEARGAHWLEPRLIAEISYTQMTRDGIVRHGVFQGLREDKPAQAITWEKPQPPAGVQASCGKTPRISHPERIIDAKTGTTKGQLAEYYRSVADWIRPQLQDRPVALLRAPEGIGGELFFQKHGGKLRIPGLNRLPRGHAGQPVMMLNSTESLIGAVQMNAIELHTWNATRADLDHPDRFVLDLDPDPDLPWRQMIEACQLTLTVLDELGLTAFVKTSGGKGLHIVVPLLPGDDWDQVKDFSRGIVTHMANMLPDRFTARAGPRNRIGKIFIDYLRNSLGATTICAYAVRARPGLAVSVPLCRDEIEKLSGADQWTIHNLHQRLERLDRDPWEAYDQSRQRITASMRHTLGLP